MAERTLRINVTVNSDQAVRSLRRVKTEIGGRDGRGGVAGSAQLASVSLASMIGRTVGLAGLAAGLGNMARSALSLNTEIETSRIRFEAFGLSSESAQRKVESLFRFASSTPLDTQTLVDASLALQNMGGDALNTEDNLRLMVSAAVATQAPLSEIAMNIGRITAAIGIGAPIGEYTRRLNEIGVIGPDAVVALNNLATSGGTVTDVMAVLNPSMERFGAAALAAAETSTGLRSTLMDNLRLALRPFGSVLGFLEGQILPRVNRRLQDINQGITIAEGLWRDVTRAVRGDTEALGSFVAKAQMTRDEVVAMNDGLATFRERADAVARGGSASLPVLTLEVTSAQEAMALFEEESERINEETELMRTRVDDAAQAFRRLRAAEDDLLVTQPRLIMSFDEMLAVGRDIGTEMLPTVGRELEGLDRMMTERIAPTVTNNAGIMRDYGADVREAVQSGIDKFKEFNTFLTSIAMPGVSSELLQNVTQWTNWGLSIIDTFGSIRQHFASFLSHLMTGLRGLSSALGSIAGALGSLGFLGPAAALAAPALLFFAGRGQQPITAPSAPISPDPDVTHGEGIDPRVPIGPPEAGVDFLPMQRGGFGTVRRPTLFLAGEAGPEQFAFSGAGRSFAGGGVSVTVNVMGGFLDSPGSQRRLTELIERQLARTISNRRRIGVTN